jgi:hypothetical protein
MAQGVVNDADEWIGKAPGFSSPNVAVAKSKTKKGPTSLKLFADSETKGGRRPGPWRWRRPMI